MAKSPRRSQGRRVGTAVAVGAPFVLTSGERDLLLGARRIVLCTIGPDGSARPVPVCFTSPSLPFLTDRWPSAALVEPARRHSQFWPFTATGVQRESYGDPGGKFLDLETSAGILS